MVSIVIVCWKSGEHLPVCLAALQAQTYRDFEVILVDNNPGGREAAEATTRFPELRLKVEVPGANIGFAAGSNRGARLAQGSWLALLNPDAYPEPRWLEELIKAASLHPQAFFASRQVRATYPWLMDGEGDVYYTSGLALRANYNQPVTEPGPIREVFSACGAAALYPLDAFRAAGGFDEDYFAYHEDVDLGFRLRLLGRTCFLVPTAVVHHVGTASSGTRSSFAVYHGHRNLVWTFVKNMPSPWIWLYLPLHLLVTAASMLYFSLTGRAMAILRAKVDAIRGLQRALAKRAGIQAARATTKADVIRPMNTNPFGPLEGWPSRQWPKLDRP